MVLPGDSLRIDPEYTVDDRTLLLVSLSSTLSITLDYCTPGNYYHL